ncbi:MAG: glucoamylase family protein [Lysobacteraceae bacterium]
MSHSSFRIAAVFSVAFALLAACRHSPEAAPGMPEARPQPAPTATTSLPPLFDDIERRTFDYFWETTDAATGLAPDRYPERPFSSIAAIGFALTAYPIGVERDWITREQAAVRTLTTLRFLRDAPSGPEATGRSGYRGFYYHFLDLRSGERFGTWVELSSVDTGLLMMGVLFAQSYYDGDSAGEREIRALSETLYRRIEWDWMQPRKPLVGMGWSPEKGFIDNDWKGYNEAMLVYVLALGSPTHPVEPEAWRAWTRSYDLSWGTYRGQEYLAFAPQFGHQYSHVWIDFRGISDDDMRGRGLDYFENSRRATLAQHAYAVANPMGWKGYDGEVWGLTACDGPQSTKQDYRGETREFRGYSARGAGLADAFDDGTLAPTAALASLPFAPELVVPAAEAMHARYGDDLYGRYGFLDSFNPSFEYGVPPVTGKVVPGKGWFASDYLGIDQGPILAMIANHRDGFVWSVMKRNPHIRRGLERAGFQGGWLTPPTPTPPAAATR